MDRENMDKGATFKMKKSEYVVQIKISGENGNAPIVKTIGGNAIFCFLEDGMFGKWTITKRKSKGGKGKKCP